MCLCFSLSLYIYIIAAAQPWLDRQPAGCGTSGPTLGGLMTQGHGCGWRGSGTPRRSLACWHAFMFACMSAWVHACLHVSMQADALRYARRLGWEPTRRHRSLRDLKPFANIVFRR